MHQSNSLYFYSSGAVVYSKASNIVEKIQDNEAGLGIFRCVYQAFAKNMTFHDRTGTITTPFNVKTVPGLEMPEFDSTFSMTFEEICNIKARSLLDKAVSSGKKLAVMYSGGIDSTLLLVSILKMATPAEIKNSVIVLMNENSVWENKKFYEDYIIKNFDIHHSQFFNYYIGDEKYIVVTGEGNDQLFGSQVLIDNVSYFGSTPNEVAVDPDIIIRYFMRSMNETEAEKIYQILNRVCVAAPIPIDTIFKWFWWINFSCKWQSVFMRSASFARKENQPNVRLFENYTMFFNDREFQQWSMNNPDALIGDSFKSYKQVCKDIIYDFNGDSDYRDFKVKMGSLFKVLLKKESAVTIDDEMNFSYKFDEKFIRPNSDFAHI